ncbi:MAG: hypothetical protein JXA90_16890, partial [Planctomycetes bacterium]|nr:hypothetical protein [Planctomycetota bacterium]
MSPLRAVPAFLRRHILENPLIGRQLTVGLTGPRLGLAFLAVNLALLITYSTVFAAFVDTRSLGDQAQAGTIIYFCHHVVLYFLMALLLPIRVSGHIEGPRFGRAFDQMVVTGASPLRFHLGSWAVGSLYTVLLLVTTLPYAGCMYLFGGVGVREIAIGYGVLLVYANVIIAVTLALAIFDREWLTAPVAILGFLLAGLFSIITDHDWLWGYPAHVAEITPLRFFLRSADPFGALDLASARSAGFLVADPVLFSTEIPLSVYPFLLWGAVILGALVLLTLGPSHRFVPGLNTFGSVVLPGDRKKRLFRRLRLALSRRVELAFFYENRPRWCERWDFALRMLITSLPLVFIWGTVLGRIYLGYPTWGRPRFFSDEAFLGAFTLNGLALGLWMLGQCDPKHKVYWKERIGPWHVPRELALLAGFLLLTGALFAVQYHAFEQGAESTRLAHLAGASAENAVPPDLAVPPSRPSAMARSGASWNWKTYGLYQHNWWAFVPAVLLAGINLFLVSRLL